MKRVISGGGGAFCLHFVRLLSSSERPSYERGDARTQKFHSQKNAGATYGRHSHRRARARRVSQRDYERAARARQCRVRARPRTPFTPRSRVQHRRAAHTRSANVLTRYTNHRVRGTARFSSQCIRILALLHLGARSCRLRENYCTIQS